MPDITAALDEIRKPAESAVAKISERGWASEDDAWDEVGPMGVAEWHALQGARQALRLLAAVDAVLALTAGLTGPQAPPRSLYEGGYQDAEKQIGKVLREDISRALLGEEKASEH